MRKIHLLISWFKFLLTDRKHGAEWNWNLKHLWTALDSLWLDEVVLFLTSYILQADVSELRVMYLVPPLKTTNMLPRVSAGSLPLSSPVISELNSSRVTFPSWTMLSSTSICLFLLPSFLLPSFTCFFFWKPRATIAKSSSRLSMVPPPSVSKRSKISLICAAWLADSAILWPLSNEIWGDAGGGRSGWDAKYRERWRVTRFQ